MQQRLQKQMQHLQSRAEHEEHYAKKDGLKEHGWEKGAGTAQFRFLAPAGCCVAGQLDQAGTPAVFGALPLCLLQCWPTSLLAYRRAVRLISLVDQGTCSV